MTSSAFLSPCPYPSPTSTSASNSFLLRGAPLYSSSRPASLHVCGVRRATSAAPRATATAPRPPDAVGAAPAAETVNRGDGRQDVATRRVDIYDTTLRDGAQGEGISFSLRDKVRLAERLDAFGVRYIEGGYPGSNEKDAKFFEEVDGVMKGGARVVAFGNTRYKGRRCEEDANVMALEKAGTPVVTLVGKAWAMQVEVVLETTREENLDMISETVAYFKERGKEVMMDAEHFFDGYKADPEYAMESLAAAEREGCDVLVLCDTNGGSLPWEIEEITHAVVDRFPRCRVGIHCHNDMDLAVANTIAAVRAGASLVQGTVNGYGERTGNANLTSIIPSLQLKMDFECVGDSLQNLTSLSRYFDEIANQPQRSSRPFAGTSAFAHKGGLHVAAVLKNPDTYQFIDPGAVGNERRMLVSELSGRHNILSKAKELGFDVDSRTESNDRSEENQADWNARARSVLRRVKDLENKGYSFEGADASIELFLRREMVGYRPPFELVDFTVLTNNKRVAPETSIDPADPPTNESMTQATIKLRLMGPSDGSNQHLCPTKVCLEVGESTKGPVDAINQALCKALLPSYPPLATVSLADYKVRILDPNAATGATTRVHVEFRDSETGESWTTCYAHPNVIVASTNALMDGFEYFFLRVLPLCIL